MAGDAVCASHPELAMSPSNERVACADSWRVAFRCVALPNRRGGPCGPAARMRSDRTLDSTARSAPRGAFNRPGGTRRGSLGTAWADPGK